MFSNLPLRQQYGMVALGGLFLVGIIGLGGHFMRQPPPIVATPLPESNPAPVPKPGPDAPREDSTTEVVVHVAGAVRNPTVVTMHPGNRVHEAILAAGGPLPEADLTQINLAAKLQDGSQLFVPFQRAAGASPAAGSYQGGNLTDPYSSAPTSSPKIVNLNVAGLAELDTLPGVGPSTAQKILDYRQANGPFRSVDELLTVPGIGPAKLEQIRPFVIL